MPLIKAILIGMIAAILIPFLMHNAGYEAGGVLALHRHVLGDFRFYWSWPVFCVVTGIFWAIFRLME